MYDMWKSKRFFRLMKKLLLVIITITLVENAFALSGSRKNIEYQTCYTASVNDGASKSFAKAYCSCFVNDIDGKYTDKQLDTLVDRGMDYMMSQIRPIAKKCYDKTS